MGMGSEGFGSMLARYRWRRLFAWFIDVFIVSLIVALALGEALLAADVMMSLAIAAASGLAGAVYFFAFAGVRTTPGLALMRGSVSTSTSGRFAAAALFGAMLLPLGMVLLLLEPLFDVFGSFGAQVIV